MDRLGAGPDLERTTPRTAPVTPVARLGVVGAPRATGAPGAGLARFCYPCTHLIIACAGVRVGLPAAAKQRHRHGPDDARTRAGTRAAATPPAWHHVLARVAEPRCEQSRPPLPQSGNRRAHWPVIGPLIAALRQSEGTLPGRPFRGAHRRAQRGNEREVAVARALRPVVAQRASSPQRKC